MTAPKNSLFKKRQNANGYLISMALFEHCHKMVIKFSFDKTPTKRAEKKSPGNGTYRQCCQLFAELFGQSRRKIQSLRNGERNGAPVVFTF
jgi:hypothetical protein